MVLYGQSSGPVTPFDPAILSANGSLFLTCPSLSHYIADRASLEKRAGDVLRLDCLRQAEDANRIYVFARQRGRGAPLPGRAQDHWQSLAHPLTPACGRYPQIGPSRFSGIHSTRSGRLGAEQHGSREPRRTHGLELTAYSVRSLLVVASDSSGRRVSA